MRDKEFHRNFWALFAALAIQNVIVLSVNLLDNIMLGAYNEASLSGATVVNQVHYLMQCVLTEGSMGLVVLGSQYWGQKRVEPIKKLAAVALWAGLAISMVFFVIVSAAPGWTLRLFTADIPIQQEGMAYMNILRWTFPVLAASTMLLAVLRSVEVVRIAMVVSLSALGINGALNYALIFGNWGAPRLGATGAAIATLVSRVVEFSIIVIYVLFVDKRLQMKLRDFLSTQRELARDYFKASAPMMINGVLWGVAVALQTAILGHMTSAAIAANSIAVNAVQVLKVVAVSCSSASAVVIGKTVGEGDMDKIKRYSRTLQGLYLVIGVAICAVVLLIRDPILTFYNISEETHGLARQFFNVLAFTSIGMSYQMPVLTGIIVGGGETRFNTINNIVCIWGIMLPISFLAAFVWHWPPVAVVFCLNSDQLYKCIPAAIKVNRYNWVKNLTRGRT